MLRRIGKRLRAHEVDGGLERGELFPGTHICGLVCL
jgi:hypothetical protein